MTFTKFALSNYRSFTDKQTIEFGIPVENKIGSGLTYIVGENNTGKTTVVEALRQKSGTMLKRSEIVGASGPEFKLYASDGEPIQTIKLLRPGSYTLVADNDLGDDTFELIPSRRHWSSRVQSQSDLDGAIRALSLSAQPRSRANSGEAAGLLKGIEGDEESYIKFIELVKEVLPEFHSFAVAFEDYEYIEYTTRNGSRHATDYLGDGVVSVIRILAHVFANRQTALIIDEPELSLHPLAQKKLYAILARHAAERQIIISTHSPYFISWDHISNGAKLNRITKFEDGKSEIHTLKEPTAYSGLLRGANWQQPFLLDVVAKEIFFHDNPLFVEGQEDVGLLTQDAALSYNINPFGYGVRGKDAFALALKLAKDLGIKKAGVILDNGTSELAIKNALERDYPEYKIVQWNREDIRDKVPRTSTAKIGYFNVHGRKKPDHDLDDYNDKVKEINEYFDA